MKIKNNINIILILTIFFISVSLVWGYFRVFIYKDYNIEIKKDCDISTEKCFSEDLDGEVYNYKILTVKASEVEKQCGETAILECEIDCSVANGYCEYKTDESTGE